MSGSNYEYQDYDNRAWCTTGPDCFAPNAVGDLAVAVRAENDLGFRSLGHANSKPEAAALAIADGFAVVRVYEGTVDGHAVYMIQA